MILDFSFLKRTRKFVYASETIRLISHIIIKTSELSFWKLDTGEIIKVLLKSHERVEIIKILYCNYFPDSLSKVW